MTEKTAEIVQNVQNVQTVETAGIVAAIETGTVTEVKEDDPDLPTIVPPDAILKRTLIPRVETTELASEKTDMALDGMSVNGIERGTPDVATMTDHPVETATCLMIVEVEAQEPVVVETASVVDEKTEMNSLPRLVVARTALLPRRENPLQTSQILCQYWIARGG